jgi:hypothetical protein
MAAWGVAMTKKTGRTSSLASTYDYDIVVTDSMQWLGY